MIQTMPFYDSIKKYKWLHVEIQQNTDLPAGVGRSYKHMPHSHYLIFILRFILDQH